MKLNTNHKDGLKYDKRKNRPNSRKLEGNAKP